MDRHEADRRKILALFRARLRSAADARGVGLAEADEARLARQLERECHNYSLTLCQQDGQQREWEEGSHLVETYGSRCGVIARALDPASQTNVEYGTELFERLASGELAPAAAARMREREICPAAAAQEREDIARRSSQRIETRVSVLFSCPRCHKRECSYEAVQTRSLDEAQTYFCLCLSCGHSFRR